MQIDAIKVVEEVCIHIDNFLDWPDAPQDTDTEYFHTVVESCATSCVFAMPQHTGPSASKIHIWGL